MKKKGRLSEDKNGTRGKSKSVVMYEKRKKVKRKHSLETKYMFIVLSVPTIYKYPITFYENLRTIYMFTFFFCYIFPTHYNTALILLYKPTYF